MSHSTVDDNASMTLADQKVLIYNTDTQETQVYDGNNVLLQGDTVFITTSAAVPKQQRKYKVLQKKKTDYANCFIAVKNMSDGGANRSTLSADKAAGAGDGKRKRKTIKASELGPEFMALMTMNADIDNRLLQHATRNFKKKYAIDNDTYIDYDYLDVVGDVDVDNVQHLSAEELEGGAKKKKKRTTRRRKNKKATKKAFGMDVDEYEELQEDVILDQDTDALGDIAVDKLSLKNDAQLSGAGNIFDQLGAQFVTQRAIIQGGGDRLIAQCECDANQQYQELIDRGAERHKQSCKAISGGNIIDDVMNVICTDKDGKVIENIEADENNPVLIKKVNIPKKDTTKSKQKDQGEGGKPGSKQPGKASGQTDASTQKTQGQKKKDGDADNGKAKTDSTVKQPDGSAQQSQPQGKTEGDNGTGDAAAPDTQKADATGGANRSTGNGAKAKRAEDYLSSSDTSSISDADDSESSTTMSTDDSDSPMSEISADDDVKRYNADGSDTGTTVMYF